MSKKTWILISCLVLSLTLGLGGSLAYLTDRDADVNVFTMGNVDIELTEDFQQGAELMPGKDITKDVKVKNTGKNDAWVWVQIALPSALDNNDASLNVLHFNYSKDSVGDGQWKWVDANDWSQVPTTDINGVNYKVYTVLYQSPLAPGAETPYSAMTKVYMDTSIDVAPDGTLYRVVKGEATKINWNVKDVPYMYVSAYAIQTEGFANVEDAYAAYNKQWTTDNEVNNGLIWADVVDGDDAYQGAGIATDGTKRYEGYPVEDGKVIDGLTVVDTTGAGESLRALYNDGATSPRVSKDLIIKNSYLDGTYAMNVYAVVGSGAKLIVSDTTLSGWTSYADFAAAEFTDCTFKVNSKGQYNYLRAYCPTTLTGCELAGTTLDTEGSASIVLVNCTFNGEKITDLSKINIETGANVSIGAN